jgi:hypothetical protein
MKYINKIQPNFLRSLENSSSSSSAFKKQEEDKKVQGSRTLNDDLKELFSHIKGYRIDPSKAQLNHIVVVSSKSKAGYAEEYKKKFGTNPTGDKDHFVNVNSLFRTLPLTDTILTRFIPDVMSGLGVKTEPYHVIHLSPVGKLKYVHITGLGTFQKTTYRAKTIPESCHEFNLSISAYNENYMTEKGEDPACKEWILALAKIWLCICTQVASNPKIASDLHAKTAEDLMRQTAAATTTTTTSTVTTTTSTSTSTTTATNDNDKQRYIQHFIKTYTKPVENENSIKFATKMFRSCTLKEREEYAKTPYKAPTPIIQQAYDDAGKNDKFVYVDMPVIRPKTAKERKEASKNKKEKDTNPFVYVPPQDRDNIKDGELASVLYSVGITESYKNLSHLKLHPLLLIVFPDDETKSETVADADGSSDQDNSSASFAFTGSRSHKNFESDADDKANTNANSNNNNNNNNNNENGVHISTEQLDNAANEAEANDTNASQNE